MLVEKEWKTKREKKLYVADDDDNNDNNYFMGKMKERTENLHAILCHRELRKNQEKKELWNWEWEIACVVLIRILRANERAQF